MKKNETAAAGKKTPSRRGWKYAAAIVAGLAVLAAVLALLRFAGVRIAHKPYDAAMPTSEKFALMSRWIPAGAEFEIAVDVQKALADPALKERLGALVGGKEGVAAELVGALLEKQSAVGMLMLTGALGEAGQAPSVAVVAQGGFDDEGFIPAVRAALASGKSGISSEKVGDRTIFVEADSRDPFGFTMLDGRHIAVGTREALTSLFSAPPASAPRTPARADAVIFGRLLFGPRITSLLPQGLAPVSSIEFASADGKTLAATIASESPEKARDTAMFLEGVRTLLLIQEEGNAALESILKGMSIETRDGGVNVVCDIIPLVDLWAPLGPAKG